jgi:hypothetical protein
MHRTIIRLALLLLTLTTFCVSIAQGADDKGPPRALISIYHIAPGKHLEFLKWLAAREAVSRQAGLPIPQFYAHIDGDSWDYLSVTPEATDEQDKKLDEAMKKAGLTTGIKAALEIRQFMSSHTDTYVVGPMPPSAMVAEAMK